MVEKALREIEKEDSDKDNNIENDIIDDIDLSLEDLERVIKDSDYEEFEEFLEEESEADYNFLEDYS
jgi:mevalonate kinase